MKSSSSSLRKSLDITLLQSGVLKAGLFLFFLLNDNYTRNLSLMYPHVLAVKGISSEDVG